MTASEPPCLHMCDAIKRWSDGTRRIEIVLAALTLRPGDTKAIAGRSGCGKSTVLDMLALALKPDSLGAMALAPGRGAAMQDVTERVRVGRQTHLAPLRAASFGYVVQTGELMPFLSVRRNIALQRAVSRSSDPDPTERYAQMLDLADKLDDRPANLSQGQRQRAAVLRAAACRPVVLLADEPTSSSDPQLKHDTIQVLNHAARDGSAVLIVTHDTWLIKHHGLEQVSLYMEQGPDGFRSVFSDAAAAGLAA